MNSTMIYLYLKTHNVTGLKYLGKTTQDPFKYKGSGIHWKHHIKKHGNDVTTNILLETECKKEFKKVGSYYSNMWNIVESKEFANMTKEEGQGGSIPQSTESRQRQAAALRGVPKSEEHKAKIRAARAKQVMRKGFTLSEETKKKMSIAAKGRKKRV